MKTSSTALGAEHARFLEELYERFRANPGAVDRSWRCVFELLDELGFDGAKRGDAAAAERIRELFRSGGHLLANLDPIGSAAPVDTGVLSPSLRPDAGSAAADDQALIEQLRQLYCGTLAVETAHIDDYRVREWD